MTFNLDRYKHLIRICALNEYMHEDDQVALQKMEEELERILNALDVIKYRVLKELEKHMSPKNVHIQLHNIFDVDEE